MSASATLIAAPCPPDPDDEPLGDAQAMEQLRSRFIRLAWSRYRVPREEAEDVAQAAFTAYLEVRGRYGRITDHAALVAGIFRHKCLQHIEGSVREKRRLRRYTSTPDAARENPWIRPGRAGESPSVLDEIVRAETRRHILGAIARLRPSARRLAAMVGFECMGRQDLLRRLGVNKNTLDSRLRACRGELRGLLTGNDLGSWRRRIHGPHASPPRSAAAVRHSRRLTTRAPAPNAPSIPPIDAVSPRAGPAAGA